MKTIVYIDGQNFLYKAADVLISTTKTASKQQLDGMNIRMVIESVLADIGDYDPENTTIRYYGTKRIKRVTRFGDAIREKSIRFADNLRRIRSALSRCNVDYIEAGQLQVRDSDECHNCHTRDYRFQEEGVDVRLAVDMANDAITKNVERIILVSSDTAIAYLSNGCFVSKDLAVYML
ncbi:MAG: NYN domain-containing protein [Candidatus Saccharimonadales bacterium]